MLLTQSAGKCVQGSQDWFWFHFCKKCSAVHAKRIAFQHSNENYVYYENDLTGASTIDMCLGFHLTDLCRMPLQNTFAEFHISYYLESFLNICFHR